MNIGLRFSKQLVVSLLFLLITLFVTVVIGSAVALSLKKVIIVVLGAVVGALLLFMSNRLLITMLFILTVFVVGLVNYFVGFKQIVWLPYGLALILFFKAISVYIEDPYRKAAVAVPMIVPIYLLIILYIFSALINTVPALQAIAASKNYIFMWSIFFIVAYSALSLGYIDKLWRHFKWIVWVQLPIVLYQAFIIVPKRESIGGYASASWDSVVGGFGGDPYGGGASGTLAFFMVLGIIYYTALYKRELVNRVQYSLVMLPALATVALAEVKVIVVLVPLGLFLLFSDKVIKQPLKFILYGFLMLSILFTILVGYKYQQTGSFQEAVDIEAIVEATFTKQIDVNHIREETGEIGRAASLAHWWNENGLRYPVETLFGHGPGATRMSDLAAGDIAIKYYYYANIARASSAQILWEIGALGLILYVFILFKAGMIALRASKSKLFTASQQANIETSYVALMLFIFLIPYSRDMLEIPAMSLLMVFLVGYSAMLYRTIYTNKRTSVSV